MKSGITPFQNNQCKLYNYRVEDARRLYVVTAKCHLFTFYN